MNKLSPLFVAAFATAVCPLSLSAATIPYLENFESAAVGTAVPSGFTENPDSAWSIQSSSPISGTKSYNGAIAGVLSTTVAINSLVDFSGSLGGPAATASDFMMSSEFRINSGTLSSGSVNFGMAALTSADGQNGYTFRTTTTGVVQIVEVTGGSTTVRATSATLGNLTNGVTYTFTLTGTYSDSADADTLDDRLEFVFSISGGILDGTTLAWTDTSPITTHANFGFRHFTTSSSGTARNLNIDQDNLTISAVPEPHAPSMLLVGLGLLITFRRRSRATGIGA